MDSDLLLPLKESECIDDEWVDHTAPTGHEENSFQSEHIERIRVNPEDVSDQALCITIRRTEQLH